MEAFVTLVATDSYAPGALVIAHRLRDLGSKRDRVCLVTQNLSPQVQAILSKVYITIPVDTICSQDRENLELLGRPDLDITFTKIHAWRLTQYHKIVFLDADVFPLQNIDVLFQRPSFSAAPDAGWPDCFNSGVFVAEPSEAVYNDLVELASEQGSFDGGDQGLLNTYFSSWPDSPSHRLPFTFNTTPTAQYGYAPAQVQYGHKVNVVHFIGQNKPWKYQRFTDGKVLPMGDAWEGTSSMVEAWWNTWDKYYGRISPYHLLSGHLGHFDSGFQTRPIVPFSETVRNAWDDEKIEVDRRSVNPMPPISTITMTQPDWLQKELKQIAEHNHEKHEKHQDHRQRPHQNNSQEPYSMIQWDPAYEDPPSTGSLGADIPDLSSYKNVWDQSLHDQQQHIWVAPVFRPEPEIMKKPEYAHFKQEEVIDNQKKNGKKEQEKYYQEHRHQVEYIQEKQYQEEHRTQEEYHKKEHYQNVQYCQEEHYYQEERSREKRTSEEEHLQERYLQEEHHQEEHHQEEHHQEEHHQEEHHQEEHHQEEHHQEEHHQEEHHQEEHHQEEHHQEEHHQEEHHQDEYHEEKEINEDRDVPIQIQEEIQEVVYPDAFPWESIPDHFPAPTRVWQDEIYQHSVIVEEVREEPETHCYVEETQVTPHEEYHEHVETVKKPAYDYVDHQEQKNEQDIVTIRYEVQEVVNEQAQSGSKNNEERLEIIEEPQEPITETHTQVIEEQEEIELQEVSTVTTEHNTALFAIDEALTPSVQTRIGEFIANLHEEEDNDISDRDLIPINFKPSSRLQSGVYTPSPLASRSVSRAESRAGSRTGSRSGSRSGSRRSSVASSRRNSLPGNQKRPSVDFSVIQPGLIEQPSKLYASEPTFNHKTPYTSAAATPAAVISPEIEEAEYFNEPDPDDLYQSSTYCLSDSLDLVHQTKSPETWNPLDALTRLKSQSESMVLKQSLTEALNRAAKEQEELDSLEPLEPPKSIFRSVWNKEEDDLPNILSGYSSPRTPIMRGMSSNLSLEIEQEKERYRQRESLMMTEPHNAVATLLEAELDLSSGSLFKRRHQGIPKTPETPKIIQQEIKQEETTGFEAAYFSEDVIKEAQRRFNSLKNDQEITISHDPLPLPSETFVSTPVSRPSHMYQSTFTQSFDSKNYLPNFGFNEQHKLKIYQPDLIEPEVLATVTDSLEIKENPLFKKERSEEELVVVAEEGLTETRPALEEDWVDVSNEEIKTKEGLSTISDEDSITIQKPSPSADKPLEAISAVGELVITGVQDLGDLKEKTVEQIKEDAQISTETEVESLVIRKEIESMTDNQTKEETKELVVVEEEQTRGIQEELLVEVEEQTREIQEKMSVEVEEEQTRRIQEELLVEVEEQATIEKIQELSIELEEKQIIKEIEDLSVEIEQEQMTREIQRLELEEEKVIREAQEVELEETSVEIEEIDDSDYTNVGHYGVEVFEVDSDTQELVLTSEGIVEAVEDEVLEIDEGSLEIDGDYLEIETLDEDRHPEMIEIDEDSLEIELVDKEFEVETMEFEEETPDELVVQESEELIEASKENTEDQEVNIEVIVHETEPEIMEIKRQSLGFETEEQVYVNVVAQETETDIIEIEEEDLNIVTDSQEVDVEVVEIDTGASKYKYTGLETIPEAEVSESNETTVYESKDTGLASISEATVSESKDTWLESISETTISEFKDLGYFTDRRITTLEPIQIIHEYPETKTTDTETKTLRVETVSREIKSEAIEIKGSSEKMTGSNELVGSPSSYFTSKSMVSSTESIQSRPSLPTRKLSIAESLLSSRYSSASILTTPVVGAFEKHTDGSSSKSDIMTRVRSYASSKAPSVTSVDATSISSSTRPSNTDSKHTSLP